MASWELIITRIDEQVRNGRRRTVCNYYIKHNGMSVDRRCHTNLDWRGAGFEGRAHLRLSKA